MPPRARPSYVLLALALLAACGKDGPLEPAGGDFTLGQSLAVESGRDARVLGGTGGGTFVAVVVNLGFDSVGTGELQPQGERNRVGRPRPVRRADRLSAGRSDRARRRRPRDEAFESRLRDRERSELTLALRLRAADARELGPRAAHEPWPSATWSRST